MLFSERRYNVIDEIAELSLPVQPQLLCVPEKEKLLSIGSDLRIKITTPIVATTHCDLDAMVRADIFRKDLLKSCPHPRCIRSLGYLAGNPIPSPGQVRTRSFVCMQRMA